ncbi:OmpA family protein [Fibrella aquatilis]|uniref:OmpA family protein n=1 Tax=Fibrella aquatilis TaxID=2817059 RepID=A0A939G5F2_9BACT|nr:OmpA family protein [Fibrella aquatilis]MBO0932464.1 OmpA family protein [Fibrella aquatilis]
MRLLLLCGFTLLHTLAVRAGVCVRLVGVVQDFATHQPLSAKLSVRVGAGRMALGTSADGTGQFTVDVACTATALLIERTGYRPQRLPLNLTMFSAPAEVYVVIPLVAVDRQGTDRPYLQTEQKHYVQPAGGLSAGQVQHSTFAVADALAGAPLRAQVCFFFTKTGKKTCLDTDAAGLCTIDFTDKDIVAIEVQAAGYQAYQGNISVEQLGGPALRHEVRLLRELTILAVQSGPVGPGLLPQGELQREGTSTPQRLLAVAGRAGVFTANDLVPGRYELRLVDQASNVLQRRPISVVTGLNVQPVTMATRPVSVTAAPTAPLATPSAAPVLADNLPVVFFDEGSYALTGAARATLQQVGAYLLQHPDVHLRLVGHTDRLGDENLNKYLGEFRAKVVANCLHWQGVADDRLHIEGYGSRFLVGAQDNAESRGRNRRVTLKLIPAQPQTATVSNYK